MNPRMFPVSVAASLLRRGPPLACVMTAIVLCCCGQLSAENKALKGDLERALEGRTFVSTVVLGGKAVPRGAQTDYPVNTVVSPEGQVTYRVEWGLMRTDVGLSEMRQRFGRGTPFRIVSIDLKDDRLELKLDNGRGELPKLKLMLGAGWQSKLNAAAAVQALSQVLADQQQDEHAQQHSQAGGTNVAATSAPSSFRTDQARVEAVPVTALYSRPTGAAVIPGRISNEQLQAILTAADPESQQTLSDLLKQAAVVSDALLSIRRGASQYPNFAAHPRIREISTLQSRLGKSLQPKQADDVVELSELLRQCIVFYRFAPPDVNSINASISRAIKDQRERQGQIIRATNSIIEVEKALDGGNLSQANQLYQRLSSDAPVPHFAQQYLQQTQSLGRDLAALQAIATPAQTPMSPVTAIHAVANEEAQLAAATGKPLTSSYLQRRLDVDKRSLREQLDALPAFHFDRKLYTTATVDRLTQLKALLLSATDLAALMGNQTALNLTHSWYGDAMYAALNAKGKDITEAQLLETKLENQIATDQRLRDQEQARKEALIERRNSLASEIVNTALMITMLEEKFQLTQVIGYRMEANKQRASLSNLVRTNRALLDHAVWNEINQTFQQMLPGLTLWQADRAQSILAELRQ